MKRLPCPYDLPVWVQYALSNGHGPVLTIGQRLCPTRNLSCFPFEIKVRIRAGLPASLTAIMIESTFILLKGIGESTERRLWHNGVQNWLTFLACRSLYGISAERKSTYDVDIASAIRHLEDRQSRFFARRLKPRDHWRLYDAFKSRTVYLDLETTGGTPDHGEVTVVGLYGNGRMTSLVRGESLTEERLNQELSRYDLLVSFFGSVFDLPFLRAKYPGLVLDQPHIDLCFAARRLGLRGGLKHIETLAGIERQSEVRGLDGWDAVRLWHAWRAGDARALDVLLRYNESDTRNLEPLAERIYSQLAERHGPRWTRTAL